MKIFLAILALLAASATTLAHTDGGQYGTPKTYCEALKGDQNVHDYFPQAPQTVTTFLFGFVDGNIQDCDGDGTPGDFDGHSEWSTGGAWLLATDTPLAPGLGATACLGEAPHHPVSAPVWVFDHLWPSSVPFMIGADTITLTQDACGDGVDDVSMGICLDHCTANFLPGLDGAYRVYVLSTSATEIHFHSASNAHAGCIEGAPGRYMCTHGGFSSLGHVYT